MLSKDLTLSFAESQPLHPCLKYILGSHNDAVVTHWSSNSGVRGSNHGPYVGKLVVSYQTLQVQKLDQLYVLVSSVHNTTYRDMTYTVLKVMLNPNK